jgi:hypothetical protein
MAQNVAQAATAVAAIVGATAANVASDLEHHLANLADLGAPNINIVNAISLKLPEFNPSRVEYGFLEAESEFRIKNITADLTKFSYVVSSMKGDVFQRGDQLCQGPAASRPVPGSQGQAPAGIRQDANGAGQRHHELARVGRPQALSLVRQDGGHTF